MADTTKKNAVQPTDPTPYTEDAATRGWFIRIIKNIVTGCHAPYDGVPTKAQLYGLYHLAHRHGVLPIVAHGLIEDGLLSDEKTSALWQKLRDDSLVRYVSMDALTNRIAAAFEVHGIDYVLLKGAGIRALYPEPWMRTSSDIDVLVREETVEEAADILVSECGLEKQMREYHNITLIKPKSAVVELHFSIMEDDARMDKVLKDVWNHTAPAEGTSEHRMTPEFFLFHQLSHAAYHFGQNGCGIRPFLDLFIIRRAMPIDDTKLRALCVESGLTSFAAEAEALGRYWFGDTSAAPSDTTILLEDYVLGNRLFGSKENRIAAARGKTGAAGYVFGRLFASRSVLEQQYPPLKGKPYLLPCYQAKRWCEAIFKRKKLSSFLDEVSETGKVDKSAVETETNIRKLLGL